VKGVNRFAALGKAKPFDDYGDGYASGDCFNRLLQKSNPSRGGEKAYTGRGMMWILVANAKATIFPFCNAWRNAAPPNHDTV
jgi:hypothetical protein